MSKDLLRFNLDKNKFVVFDFETEGLNLCYSRPWELGFTVVHSPTEREDFHFYLKWPNLKVSPEAAAVTGFDPRKIEKYGVEPALAIETFDKFLYDKQYKIIAHNGMGYDIYIHNLSRRILGKDSDYSYIDRFYDTNALAKGYKLNKDFDYKNQNFAAYQFSLLNFKQKGLKSRLSTICQELQIEFNESDAHAACYDVNKTWEVFIPLINKLSIF